MSLSLKQCLKHSIQILLVCLAVVSCYSVAMSQAQSNAADLQGSVRDPKGAVVAGATITARNTATNSSRDATSNDDGFYKITNLSPGKYEVTVKAQNYKTAVLPSVRLTVEREALTELSVLSAPSTCTRLDRPRWPPKFKPVVGAGPIGLPLSRLTVEVVSANER